MRVSLDHAHIFASDPDATVRFFQTMFEATVVWDEVVAGPDDLLIELFECHEPDRWHIRTDD